VSLSFERLVNKAGLQRDPEEVNRIIAQASVGSSFYENERKKDEELGKKIEKLLARVGTALHATRPTAEAEPFLASSLASEG
jgi:hypothetical protein